MTDAARSQLFRFGPSPAKEDDAPRAYFLVTSWGFAGSIWLAGSLNLHEDICATAGWHNPLELFQRYSLNRDVVYVAETAGRALCAYGFGVPFRADQEPLRTTLPVRAADMPQRDAARIPWYLFDELDLIPAPRPYRVVGNVHGTSLTEMTKAYQDDPEVLKGRSVVVLDLIRHPVPRTDAAIRALIKYDAEEVAEPMRAFLHENAQECLALERRHGVDFSEPRALAALHVFRQGLQNDTWAHEVCTFPDAGRLLLERLRDDSDYFAHAFHTLTQGRLTADGTYLDRVFSPQNMMSGRQSAADASPAPRAREQFERWSSFEREEFARVADRLSLPRVYLPYGYDFSFVPRPAGASGSWFGMLI